LRGKGAWLGFFAWLPYAGEAISVALGYLRANALIVSVSMLIGKTLRYLVMMLIILGVIA
jgi:membrane protein YqaA with SNARE-associated domain